MNSLGLPDTANSAAMEVKTATEIYGIKIPPTDMASPEQEGSFAWHGTIEYGTVEGDHQGAMPAITIPDSDNGIA